MKIPLDSTVKDIQDLPHTLTYVVRKRQQVDNLNELPEEKRPPELLLWDGTPEELDQWLTQVLQGRQTTVTELLIREDEIQ